MVNPSDQVEMVVTKIAELVAVAIRVAKVVVVRDKGYSGGEKRIIYEIEVGFDYGNSGNNGFDLEREIWDVGE
ncbi:hypothetical protein AgCh_001416 [Apium graveolens]